MAQFRTWKTGRLLIRLSGEKNWKEGREGGRKSDASAKKSRAGSGGADPKFRELLWLAPPLVQSIICYLLETSLSNLLDYLQPKRVRAVGRSGLIRIDVYVASFISVGSSTRLYHEDKL